jgi:transcriptional regulator with XRE-family HTH domain
VASGVDEPGGLRRRGAMAQPEMRGPKWTLGWMLRKAREDRGLHQEDVAVMVGKTRQTVSNWEKDYSSPNVMQWLLLARKLDAPWLLYPDDDLFTYTSMLGNELVSVDRVTVPEQRMAVAV